MTSEVAEKAYDEETHWKEEDNSYQELDGNDVPLQADQSGSGADEVWQEGVPSTLYGLFDTDALRTPEQFAHDTDPPSSRRGMWNMGEIGIIPTEPCDEVEEAILSEVFKLLGQKMS